MRRATKPRLLLLTSSFPRSSEDETCGYVRDFARYLAKDFTVTVLTFADAEAIDEPRDAFRLVRAASLLPRRLNPLRAAKDFNEVAGSSFFTRLLACVSLAGFFLDALRLSLRADAICSHWLLPSGLCGAMLSRLLRKPHVVVEHSGALHLLRGLRGGRRIARFICERSEKVVVVSRDLQDKLNDLCPAAKSKIEVIPMGIDLEIINPKLGAVAPRDSFKGTETPARETHLLFLGRLVEIKGLQVLLKALAHRRDMHLTIAGDGEKRQELEQLAQAVGIKATFLGQVGRAERACLLATCDALVIPSLVLPSGRTEGLPVVALEAFAAGLPVIAARVGGLSEIVADGQNGLLFEAGDQAMLAEKIDALMGDAGLRQRLSAAARQTARQYDWSVVGARYAETLKGILRTNGTGERYQTARITNS